MTRRRSPAQRAPQTKDQAIAGLGRYAELSSRIDAINAVRDGAVAKTNTAADQEIAPLEVEMKDLHKQLATWWAVQADEVTGGKARSIELGGCQIGFRLTPPKLVHPYAKDNEAAIALRATSYGDALTKVSYTLDKPAILRCLDDEADAKALADAGGVAVDSGPDVEPAADLAALGFAPKQTDEFFIAPIAAAPPASIVSTATD